MIFERVVAVVLKKVNAARHPTKTKNECIDFRMIFERVVAVVLLERPGQCKTPLKMKVQNEVKKITTKAFLLLFSLSHA